MQHEFRRVAIVNRGEAATRFIHAAREFNQDTVLIYARSLSLPNLTATQCLFVWPMRWLLSAPHRSSTRAQIISKAVTLTTTSLHVRWRRPEPKQFGWGWGFVAEYVQFADLCHDMGIVFIGPEADVMRRLGDKISCCSWLKEQRFRLRPGAASPWKRLPAPTIMPSA